MAGATVRQSRREAARTAPYSVKRCLLCSSESIDVNVDGRFVTTGCRSCGARLAIELAPPDAPTLRARIDRLDDEADPC